MVDLTQMMNPGVTPDAPQAQPAGQPAGGDGVPPATTPDQGVPAQDQTPAQPTQDQTPAQPAGEQTPPANANPDKYKDLMHQYGENVIQDMVTKYDQVQAILQDPKQLESLTKDDIVKLYGSRDNLEKQLGEILPVIQENNRTKMDDVYKDIPHEGVKNYLASLKEHLDTPEDMQNVTEVVKKVMELMSGDKGTAAQPADKGPVDLGKTMGGQPATQGDVPQIDFKTAMLSPDPAVRKQAMDAMNKVLYPAK